jgi:hypothetical protein
VAPPGCGVRGVGRARAASPGLAMRLSSRLSAAGTDGRVAEAVVFGFWFWFEGVVRGGGREGASEREVGNGGAGAFCYGGAAACVCCR